MAKTLKASITLGLAFCAGVAATATYMREGGSITPRAEASAAAGADGVTPQRAWTDPTRTAGTTSPSPDPGRKAVEAGIAKPPKPPARPSEIALQATPHLAAPHPPAGPGSGAYARADHPVQRMAKAYPSRETLPGGRGGDGLLRWLAE